MQDSEGQADHLQVLGAGGGADGARLGSDVEDDGLLQPRHEEVCPLVDDGFFYTRDSVEDDGSGTTLDVVDGVLGETQADGRWDCPLVDRIKSPGCHGEYVVLKLELGLSFGKCELELDLELDLELSPKHGGERCNVELCLLPNCGCFGKKWSMRWGV